MKPQTEKEITWAIRVYLSAMKIFHYKAWQGLGSQKGVVDIIGIYKSRFLAVEIKTEKALKCPYNCKHKTCEAQAVFLKGVTHHGGIAIVARSLDSLIKQLKDIDDKRLF